MAHLKRLAMPKTWPLPRRGSVYIAKPLPGRKLEHCMSILEIIKLLGFANTTKEVKFILNNERVRVNNEVIKEKNYPVGLFDVISFQEINKNFRLLFKNKKLFLHAIDKEESKIKPARVINKKMLKGKKLQINLDDGKNFLNVKCKVGDTLIINLDDNKVIEIIKFEKGNLAYLIGGKHLGELAKIIDIKGAYCLCKVNDREVNVSKKYTFIIGKEKPRISIP